MKQGAYQSDITQFINQLKQKDPLLEEKQREGRALLWDKMVDFDLWASFKASRVKPKAYAYYSDNHE